MGSAEWAIIGVAMVGILFGIIGYFLKSKDDQQGEFIKDLYLKHSADVEKLAQLELKLARQHYEKEEVNVLVAELKNTMKEGFDSLGIKFDHLAQALLQHVQAEDRRLKPRERGEP